MKFCEFLCVQKSNTNNMGGGELIVCGNCQPIRLMEPKCAMCGILTVSPRDERCVATICHFDIRR